MPPLRRAPHRPAPSSPPAPDSPPELPATACRECTRTVSSYRCLIISCSAECSRVGPDGGGGDSRPGRGASAACTAGSARGRHQCCCFRPCSCSPLHSLPWNRAAPSMLQLLSVPLLLQAELLHRRRRRPVGSGGSRSEAAAVASGRPGSAGLRCMHVPEGVSMTERWSQSWGARNGRLLNARRRGAAGRRRAAASWFAAGQENRTADGSA